jgi:hypothetical protein
MLYFEAHIKNIIILTYVPTVQNLIIQIFFHIKLVYLLRQILKIDHQRDQGLNFLKDFLIFSYGSEWKTEI